MKSWTVLLLGMAAGVACVLIAKKLLEGKSGVSGMGEGVDVPPPNAPWYNLGVQPMNYAYTGWNPPEAYKLESQKLVQRRMKRQNSGMGQYDGAYPLALTQYPLYPTVPQQYVVEEPVDWRSPQIDARFSSEMDAF